MAAKFACAIDWDNIAASAGITEQAAQERLKTDGRNELSPPKRVHPAIKFLRKLFGLFNSMLIVSGILSFCAFAADSTQWVNVTRCCH